MECQSCHTSLAAGATICPTCGSPVALDPEATLISSARPAKPPSAAPPKGPTSGQPAAAEPPRAVAAPSAQRPTPTPKSGARTLFLNFNQSPREIVRVMAETQQKVTEYEARRRRHVRLLWLLFPLGLPFICADIALGYNICTFSLVALALWAGAILGLIVIG